MASSSATDPQGSTMDTTRTTGAVLDAEGWKRMSQLLLKLTEKNFQTAMETAEDPEHAASIIYNSISDSKVFGESTVFTSDMLRRLEPDPIRAEFKSSVAKYTADKVSEGRNCESLSRDLFEIEVFKRAMAFVPKQTLDNINNENSKEDDGDDDIADDDDDDFNEAELVVEERIYDYINLLPTDDTLISKDVQLAQQPFFSTIKELFEERAAMKASGNYNDWRTKVRSAETTKNSEFQKGELPWGLIPLVQLSVLWERWDKDGNSLSADDQKWLKKELRGLWLKHQFPKGWISLPPQDYNEYPTKRQLRAAMGEKPKAEARLQELKDASRARKGAEATPAVLGAYNKGTIVSLVDRTVPGPRQKQILQLPSRRVESGQLQKHSNKTEDGELIVAFFSRSMTYKDDDEVKQVQKKFNYYVVEKLLTGGAKMYQIMGEELCGGREVQNAVNKKTVPRLCEKEDLLALPNRKQLTKIRWGLNWLATLRKYKEKKGLPRIVVNMWWEVESDTVIKKDTQKSEVYLEMFKIGVDRKKPQERCTVLSRGNFTAFMGPRGDKMIMKSVPHPENLVWTDVKECVTYFLKTVDT